MTFRAFQLTGYTESISSDLPGQYKAELEFASIEEAKRVQALFPKSAKVYLVQVYSATGTTARLVAQESLASNARTGEKNEASIRKYRSFLRSAAKLGFGVEYTTEGQAHNVYPTREAFEAAL